MTTATSIFNLPTTAAQKFPQFSEVNGTETPKTSYLDRSIELIDPKTANQHEWKKTMWTVAAYATLVAFAALAITAFVFVGLYAPIYLPIVAISAFCMLSPAFQLFKKFQRIADHEAELAQQSRSFAEQHAQLPNDGTQLMAKLAKMGIRFDQLQGISNLAELEKFKPLIAQYDHWIKEVDTQKKLAAQMADSAEKVIQDEPDNIGEINERRLGALECEENALRAKVQAAFIHAAILNPQFTGNISSLCSIKDISFEERALGARFKDPKADAFLVFHHKKAPPVSMSEMKDDSAMPINALAHRMLTAMHA